MKIYLLSVIIYFILFMIIYSVLNIRNRISVISEKLEDKTVKYLSACVISFTPIFRLFAFLIFLCICLINDETIEDFKNQQKKN